MASDHAPIPTDYMTWWTNRVSEGGASCRGPNRSGAGMIWNYQNCFRNARLLGCARAHEDCPLVDVSGIEPKYNVCRSATSTRETSAMAIRDVNAPDLHAGVSRVSRTQLQGANTDRDRLAGLLPASISEGPERLECHADVRPGRVRFAIRDGLRGNQRRTPRQCHTVRPRNDAAP